MIRSLVTGGAGYFGELLTRKLLQRGDSVRVLDLNPPLDADPAVEVVQADIRDARAVLSACEAIDVVFHNAAQVAMAKNNDLCWSVNRDGTRILLEACARHGVKKMIYTSSSAVYGVPRWNPVTEESVPTPLEDYGRAKLAGEGLCREFAGRGLDVSIVRPCTIMGYGRLGIFQILFEWIHQGKNIPVLDQGANIYQFIHANDFAEACIQASMLKGADLFNCGTDRFGTMRETLEHLCRHAGTGSRVKSLPMRPFVAAMRFCGALGISPLVSYHALMYGNSLYFDISKAQTKLGWIPRYSNKEMFVESYDWYLANRQAVLTATNVTSHHRAAVEQGALKLLHWFF
ncbi:MAG TPA: NAD-dependent epimerase/dehydratase family protein [Candidatus Acidoferrales bacterium]|nr:NAD-dependent epimerase/dehydratase family protein [Candidatus Acidoferrales bacterium]